MQVISLVWELLLFGIAVYCYLYMIGYFKGKTREQQQKMDEFRVKNGWLKYVSLLLGAIMVLNLYLSITGFGTK